MRAIPRMPRMDDAASVLVGGEETGGRFAVVELRARRGAGPPRQIHRREDQAIYVLAGRVAFDVAGETLDARAGDCLLLPRGGEHTYRIRSATARLLAIAVPAGIEGYYRELGRHAMTADGTLATERLIATAARHGVTITGPGCRSGRATTRERSPPSRPAPRLRADRPCGAAE